MYGAGCCRDLRIWSVDYADVAASRSAVAMRADLFANFSDTQVANPLVLSAANNINYGTVPVGQNSIARTLTVTNSSNAPITIGTPTLGSSSFALTGNTCAALQPLQNCTLAITFSPTSATTISVPLTIPGANTIDFIGTGIIPPTLSVSPASLNFGSVLPGSTSSQTLVLTNNGTGAVTISNIVPTLVDYTISSEYTEQDTCTTALAVNATCSVTVTFQPQSLGSRNGTLSLALNGAINGDVSTQLISLVGSGGNPLAATPATIDFGSSTLVGANSSAQTVTLQNQTTTQQSFTTQVTGPFTVSTSSTCASPLAAGTQCSLLLVFQPGTAGAQTGSFQIVPTTGGPAIVALRGTAIAPIATFSATSLQFSPQIEGITASSQTVTLTNTGTAPLAAISLSVNGANASDFSPTTNCTTSLAPSSNCTITIVFKSSVVGTEQATLLVADSAAGTPQTLGLSGSGMAQDFAITSQPSSATQTVTSGQNASYTLNLSTAGFSSAISLACSDIPQYASCAFTPASVSFVSSTSQNVTVTIATQQSSTATLRAPLERQLAGLAVSFCFALPLVLRGKRDRSSGTRRNLFTSCLCLGATMISFVLVTGCSSGGTPPQVTPAKKVVAGTYTMTVSASSGTVTHSVPISLIVQ